MRTVSFLSLFHTKKQTPKTKQMLENQITLKVTVIREKTRSNNKILKAT